MWLKLLLNITDTAIVGVVVVDTVSDVGDVVVFGVGVVGLICRGCC